MGFVFISVEKAVFTGQVHGEEQNYNMHGSQHRQQGLVVFF
jgi:hypothetical protein